MIHTNSTNKYLKSKKRLVLCTILSTMVIYTIIGNFPDDNKILAIALLPFCIIQSLDWMKRQ